MARSQRHARGGAQRPARAGWSLVESLMAVAIFATLVALAMPDLVRLAAASRVRAAGHAFVADLRWARLQSLARNRPLQIELQQGPLGPCWVVHEGRRGDCRCAQPPAESDATDPVAGADADPPGTAATPAARDRTAPSVQCTDGVRALRHVTLTAATGVRMDATADAMRLAPRLGTVTPAGSLTFHGTLDGMAQRHVVSALGRVRSCAPGRATWELPKC